MMSVLESIQRLFEQRNKGELECRLGRIVDGKFKTGVGKLFFDTSRDLIQKAKRHDNVENDQTWEESCVLYHADNVRSCKGVYERNERLDYFDFVSPVNNQNIKMYDIRFALKTEIPVNAPSDGKVLPIKTKRFKKRQSFIFRTHGFRIDFTIANTTQNQEKGNQTYEIEMELLPGTILDSLEWFQNSFMLVSGQTYSFNEKTIKTDKPMKEEMKKVNKPVEKDRSSSKIQVSIANPTLPSPTNSTSSTNVKKHKKNTTTIDVQQPIIKKQKVITVKK